jgi:plasmid maintenance system antidote protein VapI
MFSKLSILRGLHPGFFLERELKKRGLKKGAFALGIGEYPQTLGAILLGKRGMNPSLAMKIEEKLGLEDGFLMCLQALFEMKTMRTKKQAQTLTPDLSLIRPVLFWDTDIKKIDWEKSRSSVLKRVKERGNEIERREIDRFYHLQQG